MKLFHAPRSRSLRVLWMVEEMGLDCEIEPMVFGGPKPPYKRREAPAGGEGGRSDAAPAAQRSYGAPSAANKAEPAPRSYGAGPGSKPPRTEREPAKPTGESWRPDTSAAPAAAPRSYGAGPKPKSYGSGAGPGPKANIKPRPTRSGPPPKTFKPKKK